MRRRSWAAVLIAAMVLTAASSAKSAWQESLPALEWVVANLTWQLGLFCAGSMLVVGVILTWLGRTWPARRLFAQTLSRLGVPAAVVSAKANLSVDLVELLAGPRGGKHRLSDQEGFAGSGS